MTLYYITVLHKRQLVIIINSDHHGILTCTVKWLKSWTIYSSTCRRVLVFTVGAIQNILYILVMLSATRSVSSLIQLGRNICILCHYLQHLKEHFVKNILHTVHCYTVISCSVTLNSNLKWKVHISNVFITVTRYGFWSKFQTKIFNISLCVQNSDVSPKFYHLWMFVSFVFYF